MGGMALWYDSKFTLALIACVLQDTFISHTVFGKSLKTEVVTIAKHSNVSFSMMVLVGIVYIW